MNIDLLNQTMLDMQNCLGNDGQSIYQHGCAVADAAYDLHMLSNDIVRGRFYRLPQWFKDHGRDLIRLIPNWDEFRTYCLFHDCGKPYCKSPKENLDGGFHFPNHTDVSYSQWLNIDGPGYIAECILHDMDIHLIKGPEAVATFVSLPEAPSLLLSGLAEIHANAQMFGGLDSPGFRIKYAQIERRGKEVCKRLFE